MKYTKNNSIWTNDMKSFKIINSIINKQNCDI